MTNRRWLFWIAIAILFFVFLFLIRSILLPFVLGIFTAYFLDPAADRLEKTGLSRGMSTVIITAVFFVTIIMLSLLIIPAAASQLSALIIALPGYITKFEAAIEPALAQWLGGLPAASMDSIKEAVSNFSAVMLKVAGEFIAGLFQSGMAFVNLLSLILITPVVAFYLLDDWDHIVARVDTLLPRSHADTIRTQIDIINQTLAGFLRGQLNVCLILSTYYAVLLTALGLHFSIVIGIATGLLVIVPYAGWALGAITGISVALFQFDSHGHIGAVIGVFLAGQVLESYFLTPKLVGQKVGLHPVWIIFGMLCGAALFGFVGVLLAVPVTAVTGVLLRFAIQKYLQSSYYHGETKPLPK